MKKSVHIPGRVLLSLVAFLCTGCFDSQEETVPLGKEGLSIRYTAGDNRLYRREQEWSGDGQVEKYLSLAKLNIDKDTLFNGTDAVIATVTTWNVEPQGTKEFVHRILIAREGRELSVYYFKGSSNPLSVGLFKAAAPYDTAVFSDRIIEGVFPLEPNLAWMPRYPDEEGFRYSIKRVYAGRETLKFGGKKYECGVIVFDSPPLTLARYWISSVGLLKAALDTDLRRGRMPGSEQQELQTPKDPDRILDNYDLVEINASQDVVEAYKTRMNQEIIAWRNRNGEK